MGSNETSSELDHWMLLCLAAVQDMVQTEWHKHWHHGVQVKCTSLDCCCSEQKVQLACQYAARASSRGCQM